MKFLSVLAAVALSLHAFASSPADKLIGGQAAQRGQFPFVVNIGGCTATKTGEKEFLIAAHCLFLGPGTYRAPKRIQVSASELARSERHRLTVENALLHPTWIQACAARGCTGRETGSAGDLPGKVDLARIRVKEATPNIPWIAVETAPLAEGTEVTLAGFGCTRGINQGSGGGLRYGTTRIADPRLLDHAGSLYSSVWETAGRSNWVTPARAMDASAPALCPGDSGGPLLVRVNDTWRIAGIAADYSFTGRYEALGSIPSTNLHTRLDVDSLHGVAAWLAAD